MSCGKRAALMKLADMKFMKKLNERVKFPDLLGTELFKSGQELCTRSRGCCGSVQRDFFCYCPGIR